MKAIIRDRFGSPDVLELRDVERPTIERDEMLVRVHASTVAIGDWFWLTGTPRIMRMASGIFRPRDPILGRDVAGVVEATGNGVTDFVPGDQVFGEIPNGAHAEYIAAPAELFARKPAELSFEEAAAVPIAGVTALQGLRDSGRIKPGQRVLINGASGAVGTFAVQIAKSYGADVTAVCGTDSADLVRELGADHVIDYRTTDFTAGTERYDLIFDLAGSQPIGRCRKVLTPTGIYVASTSNLSVLLRAVLASLVSGGQVVMHSAKESQADLEFLCGLIEKGAITPVIDRRYELAQVPDAFRDQGAGHARGRKVITVAA